MVSCHDNKEKPDGTEVQLACGTDIPACPKGKASRRHSTLSSAVEPPSSFRVLRAFVVPTPLLPIHIKSLRRTTQQFLRRNFDRLLLGC